MHYSNLQVVFGLCCGTCLGANMFCLKIGVCLKNTTKLFKKVVSTENTRAYYVHSVFKMLV